MNGNVSKGITAAIVSNTLFAVLYLYSGWLKPLSGTDVFAWRMLMMWLVLFGFALATGKIGELRHTARNLGTNWRKWALLVLPTPILAFQLWLFMYAPVNGMGVDVAMGYFLFPLTLALGGRIFFKAKLNTWQQAALIVAAIAVVHELWQTRAFAWGMWAVCLGYPPYYWLRRNIQVPVFFGLLADLSIIAPCALVYLISTGGITQFDDFPMKFYLLLPSLGIVSAVAFACNLRANKDLPVPLFSMLSYLEPILLFLSAWLILGTEISAKSVPTYGLIGVALVLSLIDGYLKMRQERKIKKLALQTA